MKNIFIGMVLVFLGFSINIGASKIELFPDFIGYAFITGGLIDLSELDLSDRFSKLIPYTKIMIVFSAICYALDLFGVLSYLGISANLSEISSIPGLLIPLAFGFILMLGSFYISYGIIMGIKDIETAKGQDLNSEKLYSAWKCLVIFMLITYMLIIIPMLAVIGIIVTFALGIYFLYLFYETKNLFYEANPTL